jgi:hypothetical protein
MAQLRKTVGVYERPEKRTFSPRVVVIAAIVAIAALSGAAAIFLL